MFSHSIEFLKLNWEFQFNLRKSIELKFSTRNWKEHIRFAQNAIQRPGGLTRKLRIFQFLRVAADLCMHFRFFRHENSFWMFFACFAIQNLPGVVPKADPWKNAFSRIFTFFLFSRHWPNSSIILRKKLLDRQEQSIRWSHAYFFFAACGDCKAFFEKFRFLHSRGFAVFWSWFSCERQRSCFLF